jgi:hypothetical protein
MVLNTLSEKARLVAAVLNGWRFVRAKEPPGCRPEDVDVRRLGPVECEVLRTLTMGEGGGLAGIWLLPWQCEVRGLSAGLPLTIAWVAGVIMDLSRPGTPYRSIQRAVRTLERRGLVRRVRGVHACFITPTWVTLLPPGTLDVLRRRSGFPSRVHWWIDYAARKGRDRRGRFKAD